MPEHCNPATVPGLPCHATDCKCDLQIGDVDEDEEAKKKKQPRKITAKCWMAENFPMSLKNLLPVLEVIGNANKHLARVGNFLQKYGNKDLFPVKLQVPPLKGPMTWNSTVDACDLVLNRTEHCQPQLGTHPFPAGVHTMIVLTKRSYQAQVLNHVTLQVEMQ